SKNTRMCGIVGYFDRANNVDVPLGSTILKMLDALACRGPDSAAVALFGTPSPGHLVARVKLGEDGTAARHGARVAEAASAFGSSDLTQNGAYLRFAIQDSS